MTREQDRDREHFGMIGPMSPSRVDDLCAAQKLACLFSEDPASADVIVPDAVVERLIALTYPSRDGVCTDRIRVLATELGQAKAAFYVAPTRNGNIACSLEPIAPGWVSTSLQTIDWRLRYRGAQSTGYMIAAFGLAEPDVSAVTIEMGRRQVPAQCFAGGFFVEETVPTIDPLPLTGLYIETSASAPIFVPLS